MATPYDKIYKKFLKCIKDYNLSELDDYTAEDMLQGWLDTGVVRVRKCKHDLSKRDDELQEFEDDLLSVEIELIARGMVSAWLDQFINSTELTTMFIGGKEEKFYAQAPFLTTLNDTQERCIRDMNKLHNYYTYTNNSYFDD